MKSGHYWTKRKVGLISLDCDEFELQEHVDGGYCLKSVKEGKYLNTRLNNAQCIEAG